MSMAEYTFSHPKGFITVESDDADCARSMAEHVTGHSYPETKFYSFSPIYPETKVVNNSYFPNVASNYV